MDGSEVLAEVDTFRDRIAPFLDVDEHVQSVLQASSRPARAIKFAATEVWPFFVEKARYLLVATNRRWLVLESEREEFAGRVHVRAVCNRAIRIHTSWLTRFDAFDQPYSIDPSHELSAVTANDALDALEDGRPWTLEEAVRRLAVESNDAVSEALADVAHKVGRFVPRRLR